MIFDFLKPEEKTEKYYRTRIPLEDRLKIYKSFPTEEIWNGKKMSCLCGWLGSHRITQRFVKDTTNLDHFLKYFPEIQKQKPSGIKTKYQYWWKEGLYEPRKQAIDIAIEQVKVLMELEWQQPA